MFPAPHRQSHLECGIHNSKCKKGQKGVRGCAWGALWLVNPCALCVTWCWLCFDLLGGWLPHQDRGGSTLAGRGQGSGKAQTARTTHKARGLPAGTHTSAKHTHTLIGRSGRRGGDAGQHDPPCAEAKRGGAQDSGYYRE